MRNWGERGTGEARTRKLNRKAPVRGAIAALGKTAHKTATPSRWRGYLHAVIDNFPPLWDSFTAPVRSRVRFHTHIRK